MKILILMVCASAIAAKSITFPDFMSLSNKKFSASVYREVAKQNDENFLVSPLSAQLVLALSQSGAKGQTASEMQEALQLPPSKPLIDCMMGSLLQNLEEDHDYFLHTVNKIYVKTNCSLKEDFSTIAREVYRAPIENVDFGDRKEAAATINQWIEEATDNKIHDLIDPEVLSNDTRVVLVNALRFRSNWTVPFVSYTTSKQDFYSPRGLIKVDTMHIYEEYLPFYEKPDLNASFLELPIVGDNVSMTIVFPHDRNGLTSLEQHIDQVLEAPPQKHTEMFNVAIPKFKMESRIDLKTVLQRLGVKKAFEDGEADFSGIAGEKGELFVDDVVQKTFVDVNESGIEAAAATFVVKIVNRNAETPREFFVNHPFLFFVKVEDLVVFVGRVVVPYY